MALAMSLHRMMAPAAFARRAVVPSVLRSFSSMVQAEAAPKPIESLPNLSLAPEKPVRPPRMVKFTDEIALDGKGNISLPVVSFATDEKVDNMTLDASVFAAPNRVDILQRVVRWQLACRRAGTNKTKTRSETSGSTRKPWRQKGSGRARVGDIRAPQWRGGYTVHGPKLRDFSYSLPKKVRAMGMRVALSTKLREGKLAIVDNLEVETYKTKPMKQLLELRGWDHALFVGDLQAAENLALSIGNIPNVEMLAHYNLNVYSILHKDLLILTKEAAQHLSECLAVK